MVQSQLLVSAGKGRPIHELAELLSRPGGGLWNSAIIVPSSFGSPLVVCVYIVSFKGKSPLFSL